MIDLFPCLINWVWGGRKGGRKKERKKEREEKKQNKTKSETETKNQNTQNVMGTRKCWRGETEEHGGDEGSSYICTYRHISSTNPNATIH